MRAVTTLICSVVCLTAILGGVAAPARAASLEILIHRDQLHRGVSIHRQPFWWRDAGIGAAPVVWREPGGQTEFATADDGTLDLTEIAVGDYMIKVRDVEGECTSHNQGRRVFEAIDDGHIKLVAFGDSNGVYGSPYPYPNRLADRLNEFADTEMVNLSISGSTADEWLPGGNYFENNLVPELADADVVTFTLGGNDLQFYMGMPPYTPEELWEKIVGLPALMQNIVADLQVIADEVHVVNPDADLVFVMYPVFANSDLWQQMLAELWPVLRVGNQTVFGWVRHQMSDLPYLLIADVMGAFYPGEMIDAYLYDEIHPNDLGHQLYADEIFMALGGVIVENEADDLGRYFAYSATR